MRDVVDRREREMRLGRHREPRAAGAAVRVDGLQVEPALEPAPGDVAPVEQVADVAARHGDLVDGGVGAHVVLRIGVADHGDVARRWLASPNASWVGCSRLPLPSWTLVAWAKPLAWPEIRLRAPGVDGPNWRRVAVVVHREVLGVVPKRRDGVAVVVTHHQSLGGDGGRRRQRAVCCRTAGGPDPGRETVHLPLL